MKSEGGGGAHWPRPLIHKVVSSILGIFYHGVFDYFFGMSEHLIIVIR